MDAAEYWQRRQAYLDEVSEAYRDDEAERTARVIRRAVVEAVEAAGADPGLIPVLIRRAVLGWDRIVRVAGQGGRLMDLAQAAVREKGKRDGRECER